LSPDINIKHENKRRQGLFDELGVAANSREDALHEKSETIYKDQFDSHIELWRYQLDAARHDGNPLQVKNVPVANFCLTDVFEKWSSPECKDAAFLFRCIGQKDAGRFLNKWMVYYQGLYIAILYCCAKVRAAVPVPALTQFWIDFTAATAARPKAKRLKADPHNLNELDAVDEESFTGKDEVLPLARHSISTTNV
jgi:hypothetical protein